MIKRYSTLISLFLSVLFIGCDLLDSNQAPDAPVIATSVDPDTVVAPETEVTLTVTCTDPDGDDLEFTWQATGGAFNTTTGAQVIWTAPGVEGTYTISVEAQDPDGETSSSSVNIVVDDGGGNGSEGDFVIVGDTLNEDMWPPFNNGDYGRTQFIYYASEINRSGTITRIATMASTSHAKDFENFKIWMVEVSGTALGDTLDNNWEGGTPTLVYQSAAETYGDPVNDWRKWHDFEFSTGFDYDGTSNLLVEFEFDGYVGNVSGVGSYAFDVNGTNDRHVNLVNPANVNAIPNSGAVSLRFTFEE